MGSSGKPQGDRVFVYSFKPSLTYLGLFPSFHCGCFDQVGGSGAGHLPCIEIMKSLLLVLLKDLTFSIRYVWEFSVGVAHYHNMK